MVPVDFFPPPPQYITATLASTPSTPRGQVSKEDEKKKEEQEEAEESGERDVVLPTALLKGPVGSVATNGYH